MKSREVALCGVLCALAAALLTLGGVIPAATFCAPVLAMAALLPVLEEAGPRAAGTAWMAVSLLALVLGLLVTNITIKPLVERARPWLVLELTPLVTENDPNSFPSGHTCAAFAAGLSWARALPWRWGRIAAVVLAVLMGLSRLYVGVHFPTDVAAGAVIGALCAWAAWRAWEAYEERKNRVY